MSGSHSHVGTISSNQLWVATSLTFAFCLGEAVVGYFSNSLALMADAGHNFADALALALSAFAIWVATKPADSKRTFGYHRVGILAALVNAAGLVVMAGAIFWEALQRLYAPEPVQSGPMIWVALLAIFLNSGIAWWLSRAAKEDLNIRGAYLHMIGDAAASFGVVIAGIIIALTALILPTRLFPSCLQRWSCGVRGASSPNLYTCCWKQRPQAWTWRKWSKRFVVCQECSTLTIYTSGRSLPA